MRKVRRKLKSKRGFSLVEVMVATVVLAIVIAPVGASLATAFRINAAADRRMANQMKVAAVVETLMAEGASGPQSYTSDGVSVEVVAPQEGESAYGVTVSCGEGTDKVEIQTFVHPAAPAGGTP